MYLTKKDSHWEVRAPAKLNLLLEVLSRRDDGFHELETLMVPIGLFDTLSLRSQAAGRIELDCQWPSFGKPQGVAVAAGDFDAVPRDRSNLVVRAVELLQKTAGVAAGAAIRLVKRIPVAAGLGGGSSDAAAALVAASHAWNLGWSRERLSRLAAQLGSDVPFFLGPSAGHSSGAVCRGRGEKLEAAVHLGHLHFVVVRPPKGLSTAKVFAACQAADRHDAARAASRLVALLGALQAGKLALAGRLLHNRLQQSAAKLSSWIERLQEEFSRLDCLGHQMTGSGTSYFGLCRSARHARCVAARLRVRDVRSVYALSSCRLGMPVT